MERAKQHPNFATGLGLSNGGQDLVMLLKPGELLQQMRLGYRGRG